MKLVYLFLIAITFLVIFWAIVLYYRISVSKKLITKTVPFTLENTAHTNTLLVLGDSTAYGVGASTTSESLPALISGFLGATYVENHAVSGAIVHDLHTQMKSITLPHYKTLLVQVGANDITSFHNPQKISAELESILRELLPKVDKIIFLCAGNVGGAPAVPPPLRPFFTKSTLKYHASFEELAKNLDGKATYINLYLDPSVDPFYLDPDQHFAEDKFHPSSAGYAVWFSIVEKKIK